MSQEATLLHCYNRGCGKKFDPNDNKEGMLNIQKINYIRKVQKFDNLKNYLFIFSIYN